MSKFKDLIAADIGNVFMNPDEFAEPHTVDGVSMVVTVDNDRLKERSKKEYDGLSVGELLFFAPAAAFTKRPVQDRPMNFDGRAMIVFDVREDLGMLEIILNQNRGR